jgi:phage tail-like protein
MRGAIAELATPHRLIDMVPGVYHESPLVVGLLSGLDVALAPVFATLDALETYVDPAMAPDDFLTWLASWVGLTFDDRWTDEQRRALVPAMVPAYRLRGTKAGLRAIVRLFTGTDPDIRDSGGVATSTEPGQAAIPPAGPNIIRVRVRLPQGSLVTAARLRELVETMVPVHLAVEVEIE